MKPKKFISICLCLALLVGLVPVTGVLPVMANESSGGGC